MAVYVDDARIPWRGWIMSHMMADELDELHAMARRIGLKRSWFQDGSIPHYDVTESKRREAVRLGAVEEEAMGDAMKALRREQRRKKREREGRC